ncbi:21130_t:CDS:1, partial [Dentiscutata erythropus]
QQQYPSFITFLQQPISSTLFGPLVTLFGILLMLIIVFPLFVNLVRKKKVSSWVKGAVVKSFKEEKL